MSKLDKDSRKDLHYAVDQAMDRIEELEQENAWLQGEKEALEDKVTELESQIDDLNNQIDMLQNSEVAADDDDRGTIFCAMQYEG